MKLPLVFKLLAPIFVGVAALHLVFGLQADVMLGAGIGPEVIAEPSLSSQNRFYGVAFAVYGLLFYLGATDVPRYRPMLQVLLWVFFAAGLARFAAWATTGVPAPLVLLLWAVELLLPPALLLWLRQHKDLS